MHVNPFIVEYSGVLPTSASGQIWDIDARPNGGGDPERYLVAALNASNQVVASIQSPLGISETSSGTLDGRPWTFSFNSVSKPIKRITIVQDVPVGVKGFAFDNFNATQAVPEPSTFATFAGFWQWAALAWLSAAAGHHAPRDVT